MKKRVTTSLAALAATLMLLPVASTAARTKAAAPSPIQHVVVIDMENHSFDNLLGFWCDHHRARCPQGGMPSSVTLSNGAVVTPYDMPDTIPQVLHSVQSQQAAMNIVGGVPQMNGWENIPNGTCDTATNYRCVGGYQPSQIPNLAAMANNFAISDNFFSLGDSPSWGGHLYIVLSSQDGFLGNNPTVPHGSTAKPGWGCNSDKVTPWISPKGFEKWVPSCIPDFNLGLPNGGAFEPTPVSYAPTIFDRLSAAGLSWRIYGATTAKAGGYAWSICPTLAECQYTSQLSNLVDPSQFATDASSGKLPSFSIVSAGGQGHMVLNSCHNGNSITACDNYIASLVGDVENGPDWGSTAIFITFDDFGGFYDQVPPPLNPDGTQEGPRLPLIIVSPYAVPGSTDTSHATFASVLAYTEQTFGLAPLGVNDGQAYAFGNAFNYAQAPRKPVRLAQRPLPASAKRIKVTQAELNDPT